MSVKADLYGFMRMLYIIKSVPGNMYHLLKEANTNTDGLADNREVIPIVTACICRQHKNDGKRQSKQSNIHMKMTNAPS